MRVLLVSKVKFGAALASQLGPAGFYPAGCWRPASCPSALAIACTLLLSSAQLPAGLAALNGNLTVVAIAAGLAGFASAHVCLNCMACGQNCSERCCKPPRSCHRCR